MPTRSGGKIGDHLFHVAVARFEHAADLLALCHQQRDIAAARGSMSAHRRVPDTLPRRRKGQLVTHFGHGAGIDLLLIEIGAYRHQGISRVLDAPATFLDDE